MGTDDKLENKAHDLGGKAKERLDLNVVQVLPALDMHIATRPTTTLSQLASERPLSHRVAIYRIAAAAPLYARPEIVQGQSRA